MKGSQHSGNGRRSHFLSCQQYLSPPPLQARIPIDTFNTVIQPSLRMENDSAQPFDAQQHVEIAHQVAPRDSSARQQLIETHLGLVVSIARRYEGQGVALNDLVQEGTIGLIRAAEKFDSTRGYPFSTYATRSIRNALYQAIAEQARLIRLPIYICKQLLRIKRSVRHLYQELRRTPSDEEIATHSRIPLERVLELQILPGVTVSLDDEANALAETLQDQQSAHPEAKLALEEIRERLRTGLSHLEPRERRIITLRYGLGPDGQAYTQTEVAQMEGVSRGRICQLEARALRKLRWPFQDRSQDLNVHDFF